MSRNGIIEHSDCQTLHQTNKFWDQKSDEIALGLGKNQNSIFADYPKDSFTLNFKVEATIALLI